MASLVDCFASARTVSPAVKDILRLVMFFFELIGPLEVLFPTGPHHELLDLGKSLRLRPIHVYFELEFSGISRCSM